MAGRGALGVLTTLLATVALLAVTAAGAREPGAGAGASAGVTNPEPPRRLKSSSSRPKKHGARAGKASPHHGKRSGHAGKKGKKSKPNPHSSHHHAQKKR